MDPDEIKDDGSRYEYPAVLTVLAEDRATADRLAKETVGDMDGIVSLALAGGEPTVTPLESP